MTGADDTAMPNPNRARWPMWPLLVLALFLICAGIVIEAAKEREQRRLPAEISELLTYGIYLAALGTVLSLVMDRRRTPVPHDDSGRPLCTHCIEPYVEGAHFCPRCACPTTAFAATAGYESVFAETWVLGKAARKPTHWIHIAGLALILAPWPLLVIGLNIASDDTRLQWNWDFKQLGALIVYVAVYGLVLWVGIKQWRNRDVEELHAAEYGHPPWWTYDQWWLLPEPEDGEGDENDEEALV